jgi:hypothetical protein
MRRAVAVLSAIVCCGPLAAAGAQTSVPVLTPSQRAHLKAERFQVVTSVRGLPLGVREELQRLFGPFGGAIADPGEPFRATDVVTDPTLPSRRLSVAGCSHDHCLVYYERGGFAHVWNVVLLHWTPERTRTEGGGMAQGGLRSVDEVRAALLSGAVKESTRTW